MRKKILFSIIVVILAIASLVFTYIVLPSGNISGTINDNGDFILTAPYKLDSQGFLEVHGVLGLLQYRSPLDPNALCMGPNFAWGQTYDIVAMRGWPLPFWYETGMCGPPTQILIIPLALDMLFLIASYSLILATLFNLTHFTLKRTRKCSKLIH